MSTATLVPRLRETVRCAYERSRFFRNLYGALPMVSSVDDFQNLPVVTRHLLEKADGATDLVSLDDEQLVMELNGLSSVHDTFPFTPLENENDMERRYRRVVKVLHLVGASRQSLILLTDDQSIYFASEIERVLPWPIVIALCGGNGDSTSIAVPPIVGTMSGATIVLATHHSVRRIPSICKALVTFNRNRSIDANTLDGCSIFDVFTTNLVPWLAISDGSGTYDTLDGLVTENGKTERQFYLERGTSGTLVVTVLNSLCEPGALPIVRYDTALPVEAVDEHKFTIRRSWDSR